MQDLHLTSTFKKTKRHQKVFEADGFTSSSLHRFLLRMKNLVGLEVMITFFEDSQHHNNNNDNQKGHLGKSKLCMIICMFFLEDFLQVFFSLHSLGNIFITIWGGCFLGNFSLTFSEDEVNS